MAMDGRMRARHVARGSGAQDAIKEEARARA